MANVIVFYTF